MATTPRAITAVSLWVILAACGGGGDDTSTTANTEMGSSQSQNVPSNGIGTSGNGAPTGGTSSNTGTTGNSSNIGTTQPTDTSGGNAGAGSTPPSASNSGGNTGSPLVASGGNTGSGAQTPSDSSGGTSGTTSPSFAYDTTARFNTPSDMVIDGAGNLYVLDLANKAIRKIAATGDVTTLPSTYSSPRSSMAIDNAGNLYVIDGENIYKVSSSGERTLVMTYPAKPGSTQAVAVAADADGEGFIYVLARYRNLYWVHKIDPNNPPQGTFLGNGTGPHHSVYSINTYGEITGIASDTKGNLALSISGPVTDSATIHYVPRSAQPVVEPSSAVRVWRQAPGIPKMAFDAAGNLWLAKQTYFPSDGTYHFNLLRITPDDGLIGAMFFTYPNGDPWRKSLSSNGFGLTLGSNGIKYVTDPDVHAIFRIAANGEAGLYAGKEGEAGNSD
jgi:hypothetical protein